MNWGQIEADWNDHKGDFQRQWGRIPETRFAGTLGRRDDLAAEVQRAYGITRAETEAQISDWLSRQLERQPLPIMK
ncbi:MAG TPA: general stress protein CsbD [Burkholderiales bacterium]|nr:general stress protein CsbD [Burkholderiales bacterium]